MCTYCLLASLLSRFQFLRQNNWYFLSIFICRCIYSINFKLFLTWHFSPVSIQALVLLLLSPPSVVSVQMQRLKCTPNSFPLLLKIPKSIDTVRSSAMTLNALKLLLILHKMLRFCRIDFLQLHLSIWFDATMGKMHSPKSSDEQNKMKRNNTANGKVFQLPYFVFSSSVLLVFLLELILLVQQHQPYSQLNGTGNNHVQHRYISRRYDE